MDALWHADTIREVYEIWITLKRRVKMIYRKFTGQKPGNLVEESLVRQQWWPLQKEYITNDYRLVKIDYHVAGNFISSFLLTYSDESKSPLLGYDDE